MSKLPDMQKVLTTETFEDRHIGPSAEDRRAMLKVLGFDAMDKFIDQALPPQIRLKEKLALHAFPAALGEKQALKKLKSYAKKNTVYRSLIGMGYSDTFTPAVIQRNILENPGWYTQYTPYQPEISQGRLEALLNYQTMVCDLTGFQIANASMLDEGTAAAEAMTMSLNVSGKKFEGVTPKYFVSETCHPQTIGIVKTRAAVLGIEVLVGSHESFKFEESVFGALVQYPDTFGKVSDYRGFIADAHTNSALVTVAADILALALLVPPAELGADIAVGNTQRFGVPLGYGGPHAAYFATKDEYKRLMPGRLVGMSKDSSGKPALRLALQTREQHIRREKATSNICTAQVLLAVMAGMYAVYHGAEGIKRIAAKVNFLTAILARGLASLGAEVLNTEFFDTLKVRTGKEKQQDVLLRADKNLINLRVIDAETVGISLDETSDIEEVATLLEIFGASLPDSEAERMKALEKFAQGSDAGIPAELLRNSPYLTHPVFKLYHSETEFLRYVRKLESRDLSLTASMIPLGSCTMKLNATSQMFPVSWPEFSSLHPFCPAEQARGYAMLFNDLESGLADITGFDAVSLQPNAGSQGEYAGLLAIRGYLDSQREHHRNVCLIPKSAHGTNPASAVMAGMKVVVVECDQAGNIDPEDLKKKAAEHSGTLAALMITYPSTHGVYEETVKDICEVVHKNGGQVYMDGANLNAQVGLCKPADLGADVCHINLHKTFCIPHGGGGPGMGPIGVRKHLTPFLPSHPCVDMGFKPRTGPVSAAPWGSASILVIPWVYMATMGAEGLTNATETAILNANYIAKKLDEYYPVLYKGKNGLVAHECILDLRPLKKTANVEVEDVAKRLMDYGFHAPTVSFPVPGTLMVEPTESESRAELDRFCDAMISIWKEIKAIETGEFDPADNPLKNAPHTMATVLQADWSKSYSREQAAFPAEKSRDYKFWPYCGRVDGVYGDRNLICSCAPLEEYV